MTLPTHDTLVGYPDGDLASSGTVLHVERLAEDRHAVILDRTAFHPVDTAWPDQPADHGALIVDGAERPLVDGLTGGIHEGALHVGDALPVRGGTPGWVFVVAHVLEGEPPAVGDTVEVAVDAEHRRALSAGHTACHLASLALDAALRDAWTKPVPSDALGHPAFDQLAIESSRIHRHGSVDVYRIGKSLRRKGFAPEALDDLAAIETRIGAQLDAWVRSGARVSIERDAPELSARRSWVCALPEGDAVIPCGGTHLGSLDEIAGIDVRLSVREVTGGRELEMVTTARPVD